VALSVTCSATSTRPLAGGLPYAVRTFLPTLSGKAIAFSNDDLVKLREFIVGCLLFIVYCLLFIVYCLLFIVG